MKSVLHWFRRLAWRWGKPRQPLRKRVCRPLLLLEALEDRVLPSTFTVLNTADSGPGSLYQAIQAANNHPNDKDSDGLPDLDVIAFNIPSGNALTILVGDSPWRLPAITDPVIIDGTTQPGFAGKPIVELNFVQDRSYGGLSVTSGNTTIKGLVLNHAGAAGISLGDKGGNVIVGNYIGTDVTGTALAGGGRGIDIVNSPNNRIGGTTPAERNLISTGDMGIWIDGPGSTGNVVEGNYIGTDATGTVALGNSTGVSIGGNNNVIGGTAAGAGNVISGNNGDAIAIGTSGNLVQGNFIGTDATGTAALGNANGISIFGASDNTIGGTAPRARNIISGNLRNGVEVSRGASGNVVAGNYIGTNAAGDAAVPNVRNGVRFADYNTSNNTIGGPSAEARNVISGNGTGIDIEGGSANFVQGNFIGTNPAGTAALPNTGPGVYLVNVSGETIGGTVPGAGNVISGNQSFGVIIPAYTDTRHNSVEGNFIGTDLTGTRALANAAGGVLIGAADNTVGGTAAGAGNVISGNAHNGIDVVGDYTTGVLIQSNLIGTDPGGTQPVPNSGSGVAIAGGAATSVGGSGAGNTVGFNAGSGVSVTAGTAQRIRGNAIFANGGLGIDLGGDGVTPNDPGDGDSGPNGLQNYPILTSAVSANGTTTVTGTLNSTANTTVTLDFFANVLADRSGFGEGQMLLGSTQVSTDAGGNVSFTVRLAPAAPTGGFVSATATDPAGNTSEFSADVVVGVGSSTGNKPPSVFAGGPYTIREGESLQLDATNIIDPENDPVRSSWDVNGDGVPGDATWNSLIGDAPGPTLTWAQLQALAIDNTPTMSTFDVRALADDGQGNVVLSLPTTLTVENTPPTATFSNDGPVDARRPSTVRFSNPFDPSAADTAAGFTYSYDFNNDGDFVDPGDLKAVTSQVATFTFASAGTHVVRGRIEDEDGGFTDYTTWVAVQDPATHFSVVPSAEPVTAGQAFHITVTALAADGQADPFYSGTIHFYSSDRAAELPDDYKFTTLDNGVHTFEVTLKTVAPTPPNVQTVLVWEGASVEAGRPPDPGQIHISGEASVRVTPAAGTRLLLKPAVSPIATFSFVLHVTAVDPYGNRDPGFTGTIRFGSSDGKAALPGDYTFTTNDNGTHDVTVTLNTEGSQTITATGPVSASVTVIARHAVPPIAAFTWEMPKRFGLDEETMIYDPVTGALSLVRNADGSPRPDGLIDYPVQRDENGKAIDPENYIHPEHWQVSFDAHPSEYDLAAGATFTWSIDGEPLQGAQVTKLFEPKEELHRVTLTVTYANGLSNSVTETILPKDYLIFSLGDSYSAGQGAPDKLQGCASADGFVATGPVKAGDLITGPVWEDQRAHRSAKAGAAQAARMLEDADPHSSVTFVSLAASGAKILNSPPDAPIIDHKSEDGRPHGGLLDAFIGSESPTDPKAPPLPPQFDEMVALAGDRPIDALFLGIGGNDVGFAPLVTDLVQNLDPAGSTIANLNPSIEDLNNTFLGDLNTLLGQLRTNYDTLAGKLATLPIKNVFLQEYPDPTRTSSGDFSDHGPAGDVLQGISKTEAQWASTVLLPGLNGTLQDAANRHGWHYVGGIADLFAHDAYGQGHGFNAGAASWINSASAAVLGQGSITPEGDLDTLDVIAKLLLHQPDAHNVYYPAPENRNDFESAVRDIGAVTRDFNWLGKATWVGGTLVLPGGVVLLPSEFKAIWEMKGTSGNVHPNEAGYAAIAGRLFDEVHFTSLNGRVFYDKNGNGVEDPGETLDQAPPTLSGVEAQLVEDNGFVASYQVGRSGEFSFTDLKEGNYQVKLQLPGGWVQTHPGSNSYSVSLGHVQNVAGLDFGVAQSGVLAGQVFEDLNASGTKESNEVGKDGWKVYLDLNDNGVLDSGEPYILTHYEFTKTQDPAFDQGRFSFHGLKPGTYVVRTVPQPESGWVLSGPAGGAYTVTLTSGAGAVDLDFGYYQKRSISGQVFNGAGTSPTPGSGLGGWKVYLDLDNNVRFDPGVAAPPVSDSEAHLIGRSSTGRFPLTVSDLNGLVTDLTLTLNLKAVPFETVNMSLVDSAGRKVPIFSGIPTSQVLSIETPVFGDEDPNGTWSLEVENESDTLVATLNNWSLTLWHGEPGVTTSDTAPTRGTYAFPNLKPGTYSVREVVQEGWAAAIPAGGFRTVMLTSLEDKTGQDFGNVPVPALTGLNPVSVVEGSPALTLTVTGIHFANGSVVQKDGVALPTTFVSGTELKAVIAAADLAEEGYWAITVRDPSGFVTGGLTLPVTDAPLTASGATLRPTERVAFTGTVATFTDADPGGTAGDFTAWINWDGTPISGDPNGQVAADGHGGFKVTGSHTYMAAGSYSVQVRIKDTGGSLADTAGSVTALRDGDVDGISDDVENAAPNGGDGNSDGILDSRQANVTSLPNAKDGRYVTLAASAGILASVTATERAPTDPPAGVTFPVGHFHYQLQGLAAGSSATVTLYLPPGVVMNRFYKYGHADPNKPHDQGWYDFTLAGVPAPGPTVTPGAAILANKVVLYFVDGKRGDDDLSANGVIVDPGAPALVDLSRSTITVSLATIPAGSTATVTLTARDANGNQQTSGGVIVAFAIGAGNAAGTFSAVGDNGDGTYTATFSPTAAGTNTVTATINGQQVASARQSITVPTGPIGTITSVMPTFIWAAVAGAVKYEIRVYDPSRPKEPVLHIRNVTTTSLQLSAAQALTPGHRYTWQLGAVSKKKVITWSSAQTFAIAPLSAPTASTPTGGSRNRDIHYCVRGPRFGRFTSP